MVKLEINIPDETYEKFIDNARKLEGGPRGIPKRGIETAINIMNNYFDEIDGTTLYKISKELNIPPWKLGSILIGIAILIYQKYGTGFFEYCNKKGVNAEEEHLKLADEFFDELEKS